MHYRKIGIITESNTGIGLASRFKILGFDPLVCIYDDSMKMSNDRRKKLAEKCDENLVSFVFDINSFYDIFPDKDSVLFFVKCSGDYSTDFIFSCSQKIGQDTVYVDCCSTDFIASAERDSFFYERQIMYISAPILCNDSVSESGPAFLPCGHREIYELVKPTLERISSKYERTPCCSFLGVAGMGCYLSSVHNMIYRSLIETVGDSVTFMNRITGLDYGQIHDVLLQWNEENLKSELLVLISDIISRKDGKTTDFLIDKVDVFYNQDINKNDITKEIRYFSPNITNGINSKYIYNHNSVGDELKNSIETVELKEVVKIEHKKNLCKSSILSFICVYEQAFSMIEDFFEKNDIQFNIIEIAKIFYGGKVVSSNILMELIGLFDAGTKPDAVLSSVNIRRYLIKYNNNLRNIVCSEIQNGLYLTSFVSTLMYIDSFFNSKTADAYLQLVNDDFYGTGYFRKGAEKLFSADWGSISQNTESSEKPL